MEIKLEPINLEKDKPEIELWDKLYYDNKNYDDIKKFILEDNTICGLGKIIESNYERFPIGSNEMKMLLVAKSNKNEILGFIIMNGFDLQTSNPELFLQYMVINPKYQHQGYGTQILYQLFSDFKNYLGFKPKRIFAYIELENECSKHLSEHFGFQLNRVSKTKFLCASIDEKTLKQNLESQQITNS